MTKNNKVSINGITAKDIRITTTNTDKKKPLRLTETIKRISGTIGAEISDLCMISLDIYTLKGKTQWSMSYTTPFFTINTTLANMFL